jgi:hypothetical protein
LDPKAGGASSQSADLLPELSDNDMPLSAGPFPSRVSILMRNTRRKRKEANCELIENETMDSSEEMISHLLKA